MNNIDKYRDLQKEVKPSTFESVVPALVVVIEHRIQKKLEGDDVYYNWRPDMERETTVHNLGNHIMTAPNNKKVDVQWILGVVFGVLFVFMLFCGICLYKADANKIYDETKLTYGLNFSNSNTEDEEKNLEDEEKNLEDEDEENNKRHNNKKGVYEFKGVYGIIELDRYKDLDRHEGIRQALINTMVNVLNAQSKVKEYEDIEWKITMEDNNWTARDNRKYVKFAIIEDNPKITEDLYEILRFIPFHNDFMKEFNSDEIQFKIKGTTNELPITNVIGNCSIKNVVRKTKGKSKNEYLKNEVLKNKVPPKCTPHPLSNPLHLSLMKNDHDLAMWNDDNQPPNEGKSTLVPNNEDEIQTKL